MNYNNIDLSDKFKVLSITGLNVTPPFAFTQYVPAVGAGSINTGMKISNNIVTVTCDVLGASQNEIKAKIKELAQIFKPTMTISNIVFDTDPDVTYKGFFIGSNVSTEDYGYSVFDLNFDCEPFRYGARINETNINGVTLQNSGTWDSSGVISFSVILPETVASDYDPSVVITLQGTNGIIRLCNYLDTRDLHGIWNIDLKNRTVKKDGSLAMNNIDYIQTSFDQFIIAPGAYTMNFAVNGVGAIIEEINYTYDEVNL